MSKSIKSIIANFTPKRKIHSTILSVLNVKALGAFNHALSGAFSVIVNLRVVFGKLRLFQALVDVGSCQCTGCLQGGAAGGRVPWLGAGPEAGGAGHQAPELGPAAPRAGLHS